MDVNFENEIDLESTSASASDSDSECSHPEISDMELLDYGTISAQPTLPSCSQPSFLSIVYPKFEYGVIKLPVEEDIEQVYQKSNKLKQKYRDINQSFIV